MPPARVTMCASVSLSGPCLLRGVWEHSEDPGLLPGWTAALSAGGIWECLGAMVGSHMVVFVLTCLAKGVSLSTRLCHPTPGSLSSSYNRGFLCCLVGCDLRLPSVPRMHAQWLTRLLDGADSRVAVYSSGRTHLRAGWSAGQGLHW